ncbi:MAG: branched-chain amino acid ABC transporter permease, partial [Desulfobacterales bacterium]|nr:branched-chain amino acid ABC transporter permease [Desulfobacterales bacterium]
MKDKQFYAILLAFTGLFSLSPFVLDDYNLHVVIVCLFYTMMASSWNLIAGYTGQVSFAHAAFAGIGAYTSGILAAKAGFSPWVGVGIGVVAAAVLGLGVGVLCLRMGGIYLSLTTLGFSEIRHIIITNEYEFTRGTMGLQVPGLIANYSKSAYLYIFLAGPLIILVVLYKLIHSNVGLNFRALQNDE